MILIILSRNDNYTGKVNQTTVATTLTRKQTSVTTRQSDDSLIQLAQDTFKILPATAESKANPLTPEKIKLGKILFYDTRLSKTG